MSTTKKVKALHDHVNATMGKGTVSYGSDPYWKVEYLATGVAPVDDLLGGGIAYGRFVEFFGNYSTLKSYVGLKAIASCQAKGELAALIDTEHSFDPKWAKECGVDVENLVLKQPETGEQAVDLTETLIRGGVNLIVFDSIAATLPKAEKDTMLSGDKNIQPARLASLMSLAMRKLTAANKKTAMIWINQTRINVGQMFGNPETTSGGKAMGFYASMRLSLRKAGMVTELKPVVVMKDGRPTKTNVKMNVAVTIRATLEKSKLNQPHRDVMFDFDFRRHQIDEWLYLATQALDSGYLEYGNKGMWWENKKGAKKYRGRAAFEAVMTEEKLRTLLGKPLVPVGQSPAGPSKAAKQKRNSSKRVVRKSTQTAGRGRSKTTATTKTTSTKSRTPRKVIRSKR